MEAAIRNLVGTKRALLHVRRVLRQVARRRAALRQGSRAAAGRMGPAISILPRSMPQLATGGFDAVTLIHNETSTGVMNPLAEICRGDARNIRTSSSIVDSVSSFSAVPIPMDELGIDVLLTGSQKALALAAGLRALQRLRESLRARRGASADRGYYFDFLEFKKNQESDMTPTTPSIAHIYALAIEARRHLRRRRRKRATPATRAQRARPRLGAAPRLRFLRRGRLPLRQPHLRAQQPRHRRRRSSSRDLRRKHHLVIDGGYGKIKGQTFRLSNMGDETEETVSHLLACLDACVS